MKKLAAQENRHREQVLQVAFSHWDAPPIHSVVFLLRLNCISLTFSTHVGLCTWVLHIFLASFSTNNISHANSSTYNIPSQIKHRSCCQQITNFLKPKEISATHLKLWLYWVIGYNPTIYSIYNPITPLRKERKARLYPIFFIGRRSLFPSAKTLQSKPC